MKTFFAEGRNGFPPLFHALTKLILPFLALLSLLTACVDPEGTVRPDGTMITENRVDLRAHQTPIRNQGSRGTCITFAATAALEAAYKKNGYGEMDFSEEFVNYFGKMFWLHPNWNEILAKGDDGSESQVSAFGGGGGVGYLEFFSHGFRIPEETAMPYRSGYSTATFPMLNNPWDSSYWFKQKRMSDFNLDTRNISKDIIRSNQYFGASTIVKLTDPTSTSEIEAILKLGKEVVWDFYSTGTNTTTDNIWRKCTTCTDTIAHSMVIVGFDKTDADPQNHYFIVKNSWGSTSIPDADGFTYISYDFISFGTAAGYILNIRDPAPWPELAFIGRWNLNFDGWKGILDIYHLPRMMQWVFDKTPAVRGIEDSRLGSFYDQAGNAFKVNGQITGNKIEFWIDGSTPNLRWDKFQGRHFVYYLSQDDSREWMAGIHYDGPGSSNPIGGYALKGNNNEYFSAGTRTPRPIEGGSYTGSSWEIKIGENTYIFNLNNDPPSETTTELVYSGAFTSAGSDLIFAVKKTSHNKIRIQFRADGKLLRLNGIHLNWENGAVAGSLEGLTDGKTDPFYMRRL